MPQKRPAPRLALLDEAHMNDAQRALLASLRAGPRGQSITPRGPFAAWMHAPEFGQLAQALGAHCRYKTARAAAAVGIRHSVHRAAVARAIRMVRARADGREGRRQAEDH